MEETQPIQLQPRKFNAALVTAIIALLFATVITVFATIYIRNLNVILHAMSNNNQLLHKQIQQIQGIQVTLLNNNNRQQQQLIKIQQLAVGDHQPWQMAEIDYLVRLASYNLSYSHDAAAALALLQTADQRLAQLNNPSFNQVRQQLANAITPLQVAAKIDTAGTLAKLTALQQQITELPLVVPPAFAANKNNKVQTSPATSKWRQMLDNSLQTLKALVVIRHHQEPIEPLLDAEHLRYLQQNLQLQLQQAQWAVLHGQQNLYQTSLQQAITWVKTYFTNTSPQTTTFIQNLQQLQQIDIQPKLPNLNALLDAVAQVNHPVANKTEQVE